MHFLTIYIYIYICMYVCVCVCVCVCVYGFVCVYLWVLNGLWLAPRFLRYRLLFDHVSKILVLSMLRENNSRLHNQLSIIDWYTSNVSFLCLNTTLCSPNTSRHFQWLNDFYLSIYLSIYLSQAFQYLSIIYSGCIYIYIYKYIYTYVLRERVRERERERENAL